MAMIAKDHENNIFNSQKEMCEYWNINVSTYLTRINNGMSVKDALTYQKPIISDHLGNTFETWKQLYKYWNISESTYKKREQLGMSQKEILERPKNITIKKYTVNDHLGNTFGNIKEMCKYWNISKSLFNTRKKLGYSLKDIFEEPKNPTSQQCCDHLGNIFPSYNAMFRHYHTTKGRYNGRLKMGWSIKDALTIPARCDITKCQDHLGNEFSSQSEMCKYWNINISVYSNRINKQKMSMKDALETPNNNILLQTKDHLGNLFPSQSAMCKHWDISLAAYKRRLKDGWSQKDALEKSLHQYTIEDHLGNKYPTIAAMLEYWNISSSTYTKKIKENIPLEEILTCTKHILHTKQTTTIDIIGNTFATRKDMCKYWHTTDSAYIYRIKTGYSQIEALNIIPKLSNKTEQLILTQDLYIIKSINSNTNKSKIPQYFLCIYDKNEIIFHRDFIIKYCTEELQKQYATKQPILQPAYAYAEE